MGNRGVGVKFDYVEIPADLKEQSIKYRKELVELAVEQDRKSTRLNSSHAKTSRMPSSA